VVVACLAEDGWSWFGGYDLVAPPLVLSESCSVLHETQWRKDLPHELARLALDRLIVAPIRLQPLESHKQAWEIAELLGWAKTYDAEYVALARSLGCTLVTLDDKLRRGVRDLVKVMGPADL
jgi:predicted nucleic acid-binding protein